MNRSEKWLAPLLHAVSVGIIAAMAYWSAKPDFQKATLIGVLAIGISRGFGWWVLRYVGPRRKPGDTAYIVRSAKGQLRQLQRAINGQVHDLVNVLATLKAELDITLEGARRRLEKHYEEFPDEEADDESGRAHP